MVPVIFKAKLTVKAILYPFEYLKECVSFPYPVSEIKVTLLLELIKYWGRKKL